MHIPNERLGNSLFKEPVDYDSFESMENAYRIHYLYRGKQDTTTWKEVIL